MAEVQFICLMKNLSSMWNYYCDGCIIKLNSILKYKQYISKNYEIKSMRTTPSNNPRESNPPPQLPQHSKNTQGDIISQADPNSTQPKIRSTFNQTKQYIRQSRSGSIKQKLNLENTRLKINVDNLSSLISVHQNNESKYKLEVERLKQKILKYKQKIKGKDGIITKLLEKLEKRIEIGSNNFTSIMLKLHEDSLKEYKNKLSRNQPIPSGDVLNKYEELVKSFAKQEKQKLYLKHEKQDLQKTVRQLKDTLKYIGQGKSQDQDKQRYTYELQRQRMKIKLNQVNILLEQQKNVRNHLMDIMSANQIELLPETKTMLSNLQRGRGILASTQAEQSKKDQKSNFDISNLKQKLAQSQSNLFRQRQARKGTQKHCSLIQEQIQGLSKNIVISNHNLQSLKQRLQKIQAIYSKQVSQLQQKTQILLQNETNLQQYKTHIEQTSNKFSQSVKNFADQSAKWAKLEAEYQRKIDEYRSNKRMLTDKLEKEIQKRRLFELKIAGDKQNSDKNIEQLIQDDQTVYLDEKIDNIQKQAQRNKKENEELNYQLMKNEKAYEVLDQQLKDANQRIQKLEGLLKTHNISQFPNHSSEPQSPLNLEKINKQLGQEVSHLQNEVNELKLKVIDLQANLDIAHNQNLKKSNQNMHLTEKLKNIGSQNNKNKKIMEKGERYVQSSTNEGGYQVNIISVNDLPKEIQRMQFEELASRYLAVVDELMFLKNKLQQNLNASQQKPQRQPQKPHQQTNVPVRPQPGVRTSQYQSNLEMILSQTQNEPQDGYSQQIDDTTYKNINQQMDRLLAKNKQLQRQLNLNKTQQSTQVNNLLQLNNELKQKLKSAQEINTNLSNIVVHLQSQLSRYQNNLDISMQEQRGSQIMDASGHKDSGMYSQTQIQKVIQQKRKQLQDLVKIGTNNKDNQTKLKILENQIHSLENKKHKKQQRLSQQMPLAQCHNCQNLTKLTSELIQKLTKLQKQKQQKIKSYQRELDDIQSSKVTAVNGNNKDPKHQQLYKDNQNLRRLLAEIKTQLNYENKQQQQYQNEIKNLREINQELVGSIHDKQRQMLKLRTQIYRQNYGAGVMNEASAKKIDDIFESYEKKVEDLENIIKSQERNEVNISDLYDTINYLNAQCQNLRKNAEQGPKGEPAHPSVQIQLQAQQPKIPQTYPQLTEKYKDLHQYLSNLTKTASLNNYANIQAMLNSVKEQKDLNVELMKQNNKLQTKIANLNAKNQQYFKKINQGKIYQIIQDKDKENEELKSQVDSLGRQREKMFEENNKINRDLKSIEENIEKLTGGKISSVLQTTIGTDRSTVSKITPPQDPLSRLTQKLQTFKSTLLQSSHKTRPTVQLPSCPQLPTIQQIIIIMLDRLHFAWNMIEQRTQQYQSLRDQMNIISMECMKNNAGGYQFDGKMEKSHDSRSPEIQMIQERYEEVLGQLAEYQTQNKRLQREVTRLKQQLNQYKKQIQQIHSRYISQVKSQSSEQPPYNQQILNKLLESGTSSINNNNNNNGQMPQIIKLFLMRIKQLESNLEQIEIQFQEKNRKLENIIQKEKSFMSEKSKTLKESDEIIISDQPARNNQKQKQGQDLVSPNKGMSASVNINMSPHHLRPHVQQTDQKSYSLNSARVFKQIEELTRLNEDLRDKKHKYRIILEHIVKIFESTQAKSSIQQSLMRQIELILKNINIELEDQGRREHSAFDFEGDYILSSSFAQKAQGSARLMMNKGGLEQVEHSLEGVKSLQNIHKAKKSQQANKKINANLKFLDQNKYLFEGLLTRLHNISSSSQSLPVEEIKNKLASKFSEKELQQMLYLTAPEQAVQKIITTIEQATPIKRSNMDKQKQKNDDDVSIEEGEWVQTEQLEAIINKIYPNKSQLCLIVANSINMLMLAETKQGILKAVQFLFTNLKKKQYEIRDEMKKRDQSVTEYGRKLQKLLTSKFSQEQSQQKSQLLNENSFRRTQGFRSEYQIKKQQDKKNLNKSESNNSHSQSHSNNSGFINQK